MDNKYKMPVLIPAAMPGVPLLTLFSSCVLHMAHCASDTNETPVIKASVTKLLKNVFFMDCAYTD